jgi:hypothetical protein
MFMAGVITRELYFAAHSAPLELLAKFRVLDELLGHADAHRARNGIR